MRKTNRMRNNQSDNKSKNKRKNVRNRKMTRNKTKTMKWKRTEKKETGSTRNANACVHMPLHESKNESMLSYIYDCGETAQFLFSPITQARACIRHL